MIKKIVEICVDNLESLKNAIFGGANRIELCSALAEGGLTPSVGFLKAAKEVSPNIPIFCMVRCRSGNFQYTPEEIKVMIEDTKLLKENGADGFVFGALNENFDIDIKKCREVVKVSHPLPVTFHRAFDDCNNPLLALETIADIGFKRILTSGQKANALDGKENIQKYIEHVNEKKLKVTIMPGCGINENNLEEFLSVVSVTEIHGSASTKKTDIGTNKLFLGPEIFTDQDKVKQLVQIINNFEAV